jgi:hypothetical protein
MARGQSYRRAVHAVCRRATYAISRTLSPPAWWNPRVRAAAVMHSLASCFCVGGRRAARWDRRACGLPGGLESRGGVECDPVSVRRATELHQCACYEQSLQISKNGLGFIAGCCVL